MRRKNSCNKIIRNALEETGVFYYELADILGKSPSTISVWLRHEMPEEEQMRIAELIREFAKNSGC